MSARRPLQALRGAGRFRTTFDGGARLSQPNAYQWYRISPLPPRLRLFRANSPSKVAASETPFRNLYSAVAVVRSASLSCEAPLTRKLAPGSARKVAAAVLPVSKLWTQASPPAVSSGQHIVDSDRRKIGDGSTRAAIAAPATIGRGSGDIACVAAIASVASGQRSVECDRRRGGDGSAGTTIATLTTHGVESSGGGAVSAAAAIASSHDRVDCCPLSGRNGEGDAAGVTVGSSWRTVAAGSSGRACRGCAVCDVGRPRCLGHNASGEGEDGKEGERESTLAGASQEGGFQPGATSRAREQGFAERRKPACEPKGRRAV